MFTKTIKVDRSEGIGFTGFNAYHGMRKIKKALNGNYRFITKSDTGTYYIDGLDDFFQIRISNHTRKMCFFDLNRLTEDMYFDEVSTTDFNQFAEFDICTTSALEAFIQKLTQ
jgi:hypothetical protein